MALDLNAIRNELNRISSKGNQNQNYLENFVPMPDGEGSVTLRLLPAAENQILPFSSTRTHKVNGRNYHCPRVLVDNRWQGVCPICDELRSIWKAAESAPSKEESEALKAEYGRIKANERYYWNVIVRQVITKDGQVLNNVGPKIWSVGKKMQAKILRAIEGDKVLRIPGYGDITDHMTGRDICVVKRIAKGSGNFTYPNYDESMFLAPSAAGTQAEIDKWMSSLHDLSTLRKVLPLNEIEQALRYHKGIEVDPNGGYNKDSDDDDDAPAFTPKKPVSIFVPPQAPATAKPKPVAEQDEAGFDEDFLSRLRTM